MDTQPGPADDQERLFQELIKYYRQAQVGRRITGIIHAINSPLQVILMHSELLERKLTEEQDALGSHLPGELQPVWQRFFDYRRQKNQQLQEVLTGLQHLVHMLRYQTYHETQHGIQEIDLNSLILDELAGYQIEQFYKHRVTKRFQWLDRLPPMAGFYTDFSQSFCNLVDNALEALQEVPEPVLTVSTSMENGRRIIAVGDNGRGIPAELQDRIFAPFFGTRSTPPSPRAGLGLFLVRRLLAPYGGEVTCQSQPGQTWFRLILP